MRSDVQKISMAVYTKYATDGTKSKIPKARPRQPPTARTRRYSREASRPYYKSKHSQAATVLR